METRGSSEPAWIKYLDDHRERCVGLPEIVGQIEADYHAGNDIGAGLARLKTEAQAVQAGADGLHETTVAGPFRHMFSADRLNLMEDEYWLARAAGFHFFTAKSLGVSPLSDYEAYQICVYEDDQVVWFWHPDQAPPAPARHQGNTTVIHGKAALSPEEIDIAYLRPEQVEFINRYRPDVLPRLGLLKRDHGERSGKDAAASPQGREVVPRAVS